MPRQDAFAATIQRIAESRPDRERVRADVAAGRWLDAERNTTRAAAYDSRVARAFGTPEAVVGSNDFQPASFLPDGALIRRAVGKVLVDTPAESRTGSGFLISPDLFITNQHVIHDSADAALAIVRFDDELDHAGRPIPSTTFTLDPQRIALFSDEHELDYAVIAIGRRSDGAATPADLGYCPLSFTPDRHRVGMNVNIIHHPNTLPKTISIRNNLLTYRSDTHLLYETDTEVGSSGAPVFNDQWELVALHHYGTPSEVPTSGPPSVNEGIRISAIFNHLKERAARLDAVAQETVRRALSVWTDMTPTGKHLERRPVSPSPEASTTTDRPQGRMEAGMSESQIAQRIIIPIEIELRVGTPRGGEASSPANGMSAKPSGAANELAPARPTRRLVKAAEATKLDTNYSDRNGFDSKFVLGLDLDLADIVKPRKSSVATLKAGEPNASSGQLRYQNFSVIMHKSRRFALLTATNIDGPTYVRIDRKTGEPAAEQPEGETWYKDIRIDPDYFVGQDFYSSWSFLFDRGHLTRRDDPTWGEFATRANRDTFHFTNCTPQHWKFNESIIYWQGIERYVLERGLWASGRQRALTVLQGPVLDENDEWAEDVQVPSAFWKVVVWNGKNGLKAVAMIADQTKLFSLERKGGAEPPPAETPVDVTEFRSPIATIEQKTGLDLSVIRPYDTSGQALPIPGEALRIIRRWSDIPLDRVVDEQLVRR